MFLAGCTQSPDNGKDNDKDPPTGLTLNINHGQSSTNSKNVQVYMYAQDKSPMEMAFSNDGTTWSAWEPYSSTKSLNLTGADGDKQVFIKVRDKAKNEAQPVSTKIVLDTTSPRIEDTLPKNNTLDVSLSPTITMIFSEDMNITISYEIPIMLVNEQHEQADVTECNWKTSKQLDCILGSYLQSNMRYSVYFDRLKQGMQDLVGNAVSQNSSWYFTTRHGPTVVSYTPTGNNIDVKPTITITFDRPMNHTQTEKNILFGVMEPDPYANLVSNYGVTWDGNKMTIQVKEYLRFHKIYGISVCGLKNRCYHNGTVKDSEGAIMETSVNWTFTTRPSKVVVLSSSLYHRTPGTQTDFFGEIQNNEQFNLMKVYLRFEFHNSTNGTVAIEEQNLQCNGVPVIVKPNQKFPFKAVISDVNWTIDHVHIYVGDDPNGFEQGTDDKPYEKFDIIQPHTIVSLQTGIYNIAGEIQNTGSQATSQVVVIATYYDLSGNVVASSGHNTNPPALTPGFTGDFTVELSAYDADVWKIASYTLVVVCK
jgi:hypothetical protein